MHRTTTYAIQHPHLHRLGGRLTSATQDRHFAQASEVVEAFELRGAALLKGAKPAGFDRWLKVDRAFPRLSEPDPRRHALELRCLVPYSGNNDFQLDVDYKNYIAEVIRRFQAEGAKVELITHCVAPHLARDDDGAIADALAKQFPGVVRIPDFACPSAAKTHISTLGFLVAGRMHACIAAFSTGVPVVPFSYSRKFEGLFRNTLGYDHCLSPRGIGTAEAVDFTMERYRNRDQLAREIRAALPGTQNLLERYVVQLAHAFSAVRAA